MEEQTQYRTTTSARLRFVLGTKATDVALPVDVPLVDVLPVILPQFGADWVEQGADHEGWVVQRIGQEPLDEDRTATQLNLVDGETVYLRPRADQLAAIDFDDLVDGVGEQVRGHPLAWTPDRTRWMFRIGAASALLLGLYLVPGAGSIAFQAMLTGAAAVVLLAASALVARGSANPQAATLLAVVGACYAGVTGTLATAALNPVSTTMMLLAGTGILTLVALAAGLVAVPVPAYAYLFTGAILFFGVLTLTGVIGSVSTASPAEAAAIGLTLSLIVGIFVPATSFRLSGLTLPMLPTQADELSEDIEPVPHDLVVDRGAATVAYSIALHVGLGLAQCLLLPMLVVDGYGWSMVLSLVMAFLLYLRSRHPEGTAQRWALLVPASVAVVANVVHVGAEHADLNRTLYVFLPVFAVGILLLLCGQRLPGRRLRPYWGRAVEILELLTAIAVVPILLQVLDAFAMMRGLAG